MDLKQSNLSSFTDINETAENILEAFARASRDPNFSVESRSQHQEREPYSRSQLSNDPYSRSQERDPHFRPPQERDPYMRPQERDIYDPIRSHERDYRSNDRQSLERSEYEYRSSRNDYDRDFQNRSYSNPIDEAYRNRKSLLDNFRDNSPGPSKPVQEAPKPQGEVLAVDDLVHPPGRYMRPPKIVIIFRGLPGSGKSFVAKNIKSQESSFGSETPRILALDDYFECDGEVNMQFC